MIGEDEAVYDFDDDDKSDSGFSTGKTAHQNGQKCSDDKKQEDAMKVMRVVVLRIVTMHGGDHGDDNYYGSDDDECYPG